MMSGNDSRPQVTPNDRLVNVESPKSRRRRERIERQTKEKADLDKMMNYNPFGKDARRIGASADRFRTDQIENSAPPTAASAPRSRLKKIDDGPKVLDARQQKIADLQLKFDLQNSPNRYKPNSVVQKDIQIRKITDTDNYTTEEKTELYNKKLSYAEEL